MLTDLKAPCRGESVAFAPLGLRRHGDWVELAPWPGSLDRCLPHQLVCERGLAGEGRWGKLPALETGSFIRNATGTAQPAAVCSREWGLGSRLAQASLLRCAQGCLPWHGTHQTCAMQASGRPRRSRWMLGV